MRNMIRCLVLFIAVRNFAQEEVTLKYLSGNNQSSIFQYFSTYYFTDAFNKFYYIIIPNSILKNCDNIYKFVKDKKYVVKLYRISDIYNLEKGFSLNTDQIIMDDNDNQIIYSNHKFLVDFFFLIDYREVEK